MFLITATTREGARKRVLLQAAGAALTEAKDGYDAGTRFSRLEDAEAGVRLLLWMRDAWRRGTHTAAEAPAWKAGLGKLDGAQLTISAAVGDAKNARVVGSRLEGGVTAWWHPEPAGYAALWNGDGPVLVADEKQATKFGDEASAAGTAAFLRTHFPRLTEGDERLAAEAAGGIRDVRAAHNTSGTAAGPAPGLGQGA